MGRKLGPITGWGPGLTVRVRLDVRSGHRGAEVIPAGTLARLGTLQRVQGGREVWSLWVGTTLWCAAHGSLEPASTPTGSRNLTADEQAALSAAAKYKGPSVGCGAPPPPNTEQGSR